MGGRVLLRVIQIYRVYLGVVYNSMKSGVGKHRGVSGKLWVQLVRFVS